MRGESAVRDQVDALRAALGDASADVRITAAQGLGRHGGAEDLKAALDTLATLATPRNNGVLTAMPALAAIEALGERAKPLHAAIATMAVEGPSPDGRYNSYVPRLVANLVPEAKPASPAKAKRKKK
jgi:hypothetical protein